MKYNVLIYSRFPLYRVAISKFIGFKVENVNVRQLKLLKELFQVVPRGLFNILIVDVTDNKDLLFFNKNYSKFRKDQTIIFLSNNNLVSKYDNFIFFSKQKSENLLIAYLNAILSNETYFKVPEKNIYKNIILSQREKQCALLFMKGLSVSKIAEKLNLKISTVATYKMRIHKKTDTKSLVELTKLFYEFKKFYNER